jgi:hypothetical protein
LIICRSVLLVNAPFRWPKKVIIHLQIQPNTCFIPPQVLALTIPYGWLQFKFGVLTCLQSASDAAGTASGAQLN